MYDTTTNLIIIQLFRDAIVPGDDSSNLCRFHPKRLGRSRVGALQKYHSAVVIIMYIPYSFYCALGEG